MVLVHTGIVHVVAFIDVDATTTLVFTGPDKHIALATDAFKRTTCVYTNTVFSAVNLGGKTIFRS